MSWLGTLLTAAVTGAVGLVASGYVANLAVRWYGVSSFEGGAGYYVVAFALGGLLAGLVIGGVVSRIVATGVPHLALAKALGISVLLMLVLVGAVGGTGRLLADVPPTIDGETLMLGIEARWPPSQTASPASTPGVSYVELGSVTRGGVQRLSRRGALWKEDARLEGGRWIVPGAVELFTSRGRPSLEIALNDTNRAGFLLPLASAPSKADFAWSTWYPRDGKRGPAKTTGITYRYRVQPRSLPVRVETVGPFTVSTIASNFLPTAAEGTSTLDAYATFTIAFRGQRLRLPTGSDGTASADAPSPINAVALLPGATPALLVVVAPVSAPSYCALVTALNDRVHEEHIASCSNSIQADELLPDPKRLREALARTVAQGRVDRRTYAGSELLLFPGSVLDVNARSVHRFTAVSNASLIPSVPPLGVSPDRQSFVRFTLGQRGDDEPLLSVTDFMRNMVYDLPIDRARMRYGTLEELDAAWLLHHFRWQRGSDGADRLVARSDFAPLPYHGTVTSDSSGGQSYRIAQGGQGVRRALVAFLETHFHAVRDTVPDDAYEYPLQVEGHALTVASTGGFDYVLVSMAQGEPPTDIVARIARAFNAELASGRLDTLFVK